MAELFKHYFGYTGPWPWKNFTPHEVACQHCGELYLDRAAMDALQALRDAWVRPIIINSGHRCPAHNSAVCGAPASMHLKIAFDCYCPSAEQRDFCRAALEAGFTVARPYPDRGFVHLDLGRARSW